MTHDQLRTYDIARDPHSRDEPASRAMLRSARPQAAMTSFFYPDDDILADRVHLLIR